MKTLAAVALFVAASVANGQDHRAPDLDPTWLFDHARAFRIAKKEHRLVFVDYFAIWCGPCQEMDQTVLKDPDVMRRLADFVLLRVDVDRDASARIHRITTLPSFVIYDPAERERFRMIGARDIGSFSNAVDEARRVAPAFVRAAELHDLHQEAEAAMLAGNTYAGMSLMNDARASYREAGKIAGSRGDRATGQLSEALSAFTYARDGDAARAVRLLQHLADHPVDRDTEALVSLTLGNAYSAAGDRTAALEAYRHVQSIAAPQSTAFQEAGAAMANAH